MKCIEYKKHEDGKRTLSIGPSVVFIVGILLGLISATAFGGPPVFGPPADACDFSYIVPVAAPINPKATAVKAILDSSCVVCHGLGKVAGAGIFKDIADHDEWIRNKFVDLVDPANSRAYKAVTRPVNPMPLGAAPLSLAQKSAILDWIKDGAPTWEDVPPPLSNTFVNYVQEISCLRQNLREIDAKKRGDGLNFRYAELTNVYNVGSRDRFQNLADALDNALNHVSVNLSAGTAATGLHNAVKLDADGILRRIDLRLFNRKAADFDVNLLNRYLYAIDFTVGNFFPRQTREDIAEIEKDIERLSGVRRPFMRADFMIEQITGDQYYDFIGVDIKRQKLVDIEKIFNINADRAIADLEIDAAVIHRSGVARQNRMIHRFDASYNIGGTTTETSWFKTYDVARAVGPKNFFNAFLGPNTVKFDFVTDKIFDFDAGEMFIQAPNGLQLFFIADKNGVLLKEAATTLAFDPANQGVAGGYVGTVPGSVVDIISCLRCHSAGTNAVTEQLANYAKSAPGISAVEKLAIRDIFPSQPELDAVLASYNTSFQAAHRTLIPNEAARVSATEPTWISVNHFLGDISAEEAAGEFNMSKDEFLDCLAHEPGISQVLGFGGSGGLTTRRNLDDQADEIIIACGLGKQIRFGGVAPPPIKPPPIDPPKKDCDYDFRNNSDYRVQYVIDWGNFGASSVLLFPGDNKGFTFANQALVEGEIKEFQYAVRDPSGWGMNKALTGGKVTGCKVYSFENGSGHPVIK